jgi:hypothetical protein
MTRKQKEALAFAVMSQAANLIEFWSENSETYGIDDIDPNEARKQIAAWMSRLPGGAWDTRLDD